MTDLRQATPLTALPVGANLMIATQAGADASTRTAGLLDPSVFLPAGALAGYSTTIAVQSDIGTAISGLAAVARTGAYADLVGRPTLGTAAALSVSAVVAAVQAAGAVRPVVPIASASAAQVLTAAASGDIVYDATLIGDCAFTLSGGAAGQEQLVRLILHEDSIGGHVPSMPPNVQWVNDGLHPVFATTAGATIGAIDFTTANGGATWLGRF